MATAVCQKCGSHYFYSCKRGMKLNNQPCPNCGGQGRTYRETEVKK